MNNKKYTPMISQYLEVKARYPDTIMFYRLGDFYEMFFEDAKIASQILDIALTARGKGETAVPMCGVPFHSATTYINTLVQNGYKVSIVEQLEQATAGKIVNRDVVKIITPGTIFNEDDNKQIQYLVSIYDSKHSLVMVYLDHYSGELFVKEIDRSEESLLSELTTSIKELLIPSQFEYTSLLKDYPHSTIEILSESFDYQYLNVYSDYGINQAFLQLISYLLYTQKQSIHHIQPLYKINTQNYLEIDAATKTNLELTTSTKSTKYSLWGFLDRCVTSMGSRQLLKWVEYPLIDELKINQRLDVVEQLKSDLLMQTQLKEQLNHIYDLKRLYSKVAYKTILPKELLKLKETLVYAPQVLATFQTIKNYHLPPIDELAELLERAILEQPSTFIRDGGVFKSEYTPELKEYRELQTDGNDYILQLETREKERTGIKNLKISHTKVFGYYVEISKGQIENVKEEFGYIRKQTLANAERYIFPELKEIEDKISTANERSLMLELRLYDELMDEIMKHQNELLAYGDALSEIDCYYALANVSSSFGYTRPIFGEYIDIKAARHPILETLIENNQYIANDYQTKTNRFMILTGPNMGGKSTFMRQNALICIMAQIGCFVPAEFAQVKPFKQIFTRMGASDDILSAKSTFMVEMSEANHALRYANKDSLILFDEIGRGTSTYDGMSLAWAMVEYIHTQLQATTIFSTHYHELTQLGEQHEGIVNYYAEVHEENDHITFLYKIKAGYIDKSYGINVAKLAKLPDAVINRSRSILSQLQKETIQIQSEKVVEIKQSKTDQKIKNADINNMTPIEAFNFLVQLQKEMENE